MDGIQNTTGVSSGTMKRDSNTKLYKGMVDITDQARRMDPSEIDMDSFVKYDPETCGSCFSKLDIWRARLILSNVDPKEAMIFENHSLQGKMKTAVDRFYRGTLSAEGLQQEFMKQQREYLKAFDQCTSSGLTEEAATEFYNEFRRQVIAGAVSCNYSEGLKNLTGGVGYQTNWKYYNSDYYFQSEAGIAAITAGAEMVTEEHGLSFQVPDYMAKDMNLYYNFNTAWSNRFDLNERFMIDRDMVPPKNFKWFFEQGRTSANKVYTPDSLTVFNPDGTVAEYIEYLKPFDYQDGTTARTWASYTDESGKEHFVTTDFRFISTRQELFSVSELLQFSTVQDKKQNNLLEAFLGNLQVYPGRYFTRGRGMDIQA